MNANIIPVRSNKSADFIRYRDAIVAFYEKEDYDPYIDYALDMQLQRINEVAPQKYQYCEDNNRGLRR